MKNDPGRMQAGGRGACRKLVLRFGALALGFTTGCGSPDPVRFYDLDERDSGYCAPARTTNQEVTREILSRDRLTIDDIVLLAAAANPELAAKRSEIEIATAEVWDAGLYPNPSLVFGIEEMPVKGADRWNMSKRFVGLSIPLVINGRIGAARSVAEKEREVASLLYVWRRREILSGAKSAFVGVLVAKRRVQLAQETRDISKELHGLTERRFQAQAIPEMELLKSSVSLAEAESDLRLAEKGLAVALQKLRAAVGSPDLPYDKLSGDLPDRFVVAGLEELKELARKTHPLIAAADSSREAADLGVLAAETGRIPDMGLDLAAARTGENENIVEAGIEIPLPIFDRNQAKIARAEARARQSVHEAAATRNEVNLRLEESWENVQAAQERVRNYSEIILPQAQKAVDQTNDGYKLGKFGYLDVLDAQRTWSGAKASCLEALAELSVEIVELERAAGIRLEAAR